MRDRDVEVSFGSGLYDKEDSANRDSEIVSSAGRACHARPEQRRPLGPSQHF